MTHLAGLLIGVGLPEAGRHGHLHQELEFLLRMSQLHPVAQILAGFTSVVAVIAEPVWQPDSTDIDEAKRQLGTLTYPRLINVRYIIEHFHVLHDFTYFLFAQVIGLAIEPQWHEPQGTAAQGVTFTTADEGLMKFLWLVWLLVGMGTFPFLLLVGVVYLLRPDQFTQTVDVLLWLNTCREILETVCLVRVQRLIDFVELHLFLVTLGLLYDTFAHKNRIVLIRVADARLPVLGIAEPLHAMPMQCLDVFLLDIGAKYGQFLRREVLRLEVTVPIRLVCPGIALSEVGLVDRAIQFIGYVELSGQLEHSLVEAVLSKAVFLHV